MIVWMSRLMHARSELQGLLWSTNSFVDSSQVSVFLNIYVYLRVTPKAMMTCEISISLSPEFHLGGPVALLKPSSSFQILFMLYYLHPKWFWERNLFYCNKLICNFYNSRPCLCPRRRNKIYLFIHSFIRKSCRVFRKFVVLCSCIVLCRRRNSHNMGSNWTYKSVVAVCINQLWQWCFS